MRGRFLRVDAMAVRQRLECARHRSRLSRCSTDKEEQADGRTAGGIESA
jgi:hypothetical protein